MNFKILFSLFVLFICFQKGAIALDNVNYQNNLLTIPSVNTLVQVGRFQNVIFEHDEQGVWQLRDYQDALNFTYISDVTSVITSTFPSQVFLKISGHFTGCGGLGAINKRLVGNQFEISINEAFNPDGLACTADLKPFSRIVSLPIYGFDIGIYSYKVNGRNFSSGEIISPTGIFELKGKNETNKFTAFEERFDTIKNDLSRQKVIEILGFPEKIKNLDIKSSSFCSEPSLEVGDIYEQWEYEVDSSSQSPRGYVIWFSKSNIPSDWKTVGKVNGYSCI